MSANRLLSPLGIYHIYNRGNNREFIFKEKKWKNLFLRLMNRYLKNTSIEIQVYCIMNNHFHILIKGDMHEISQYMRNVESKFAEFYNEANNRSGHVFQGRFSSRAVFSNRQYVQLIRYILRNPVKAMIVENPFSYEWSSLGKSNFDYSLVTNNNLMDFFKKQGYILATFIKDSCDDDKIAYFERTRFTHKEAVDFYQERLLEHGLTPESLLFPTNRRNVISIIRKCRYHGITVAKLHELTGLSIRRIQDESPAREDYL